MADGSHRFTVDPIVVPEVDPAPPVNPVNVLADEIEADINDFERAITEGHQVDGAARAARINARIVGAVNITFGEKDELFQGVVGSVIANDVIPHAEKLAFVRVFYADARKEFFTTQVSQYVQGILKSSEKPHGQKVQEVREVLGAFPEITSLKLRGVGKEGTKAFAEVLTTNTTLVDVDYRSNQVGAVHRGAGASLSDYNVSLSMETASDVSATVALANALKVNTTLKRLNLASNFMWGADFVALADGVRENKALERLDLTGGNFDHIVVSASQKGVETLAEAFASNITLLSSPFAKEGAELDKRDLFKPYVERNKAVHGVVSAIIDEVVREAVVIDVHHQQGQAF